MIYLGIDPGTSRVGWGVICSSGGKNDKGSAGDFKAVDYGCFELSKLSHVSRLLFISEKIKELIKKYKPDVAAVEKLFFAKNAKTALSVSEARGVIMLEAAKMNLEIMEFTPLEVKIAITSYGRAEKDQVAQMMIKMLGLKEAPRSDDAADALAIALTASAAYRQR